MQLWRLVALADADEAPSPRRLFAEPDVRQLVASVLAVVERAADAEVTRATARRITS